ncbi:MAG TPA: YraN family protein [Candidatus Saccharimonadales bacterium]|nr:YraN family protein [Candidatus Saccharimonadales bacterium]
MATSATRYKSEQAAKVYLEMRGFHVIEQNYRRSRYEIDIIAKKENVVYFVEVQYRISSAYDNAYEYLSPSQLCKLQSAAESWLDEYKWHGNYNLSTIEISENTYSILGFIENIL